MARLILCLAVALALVSAPASTAAGLTDEEIYQEIQSLKDRIAELELQLANIAEAAEAEEEISVTTEATSPEQPVGGRSLQLPDISVVGNVIGSATSDKDNPDRNQFTLSEIEVALQGYVYPGMRADAILAAESAEDFGVSLEEGYLSIFDLGATRLSSRVGKLLAPFGKENTFHPHQLPYADRPAVIRAFLGDHSLAVQGAEISYLLPTRNFASLQLGRWRQASHNHDHAANDEDEGEHEHEEQSHDVGLDGTIHLARLWTSRALGELGEIEMGASLADASNARLYGLDATYRLWPAAYKRLLLRGELMFHHSEEPNSDGSRRGYYLLGAYQPDNYWEYGARMDWTEFPFPITGRESAGTVFATRRLNETTYARLQLKRSSLAGEGNVSEAFFQMVFGMGPHAHPLQ